METKRRPGHNRHRTEQDDRAAARPARVRIGAAADGASAERRRRSVYLRTRDSDRRERSRPEAESGFHGTVGRGVVGPHGADQYSWRRKDPRCRAHGSFHAARLHQRGRGGIAAPAHRQSAAQLSLAYYTHARQRRQAAGGGHGARRRDRIAGSRSLQDAFSIRSLAKAARSLAAAATLA